MHAQQETLPRLAEVEQAIKHQIAERTAGRIRELEVEVGDDRLLVRGCSASFHLKQLAIQGVFDVIGSCGAARFQVDVQIHVGPPRPQADVV